MTRSPRSVLTLLLVAFATIALVSEAGARERWGPFRGQVVDVETGQPIPGAVMLVVWLELYGFFGNHRFYDAREAVTDAEGRWEIPRLPLPLTLAVQPPTFHTFAPGYIVHANVVTPTNGELFVDPTVLQMRRLKTREELVKKRRSEPGFVPPEKMPEFIRAINVERRMLGFDPIGPAGGTRK